MLLDMKWRQPLDFAAFSRAGDGTGCKQLTDDSTAVASETPIPTNFFSFFWQHDGTTTVVTVLS